jgi:tetratricopeptide (TPR) repeat protein
VLYQNAFYNGLTATRRAALSMAVAQSLTSCYQDLTDEVASHLGLLFEAARDFGRASDFLLIAAQNAARIYAVHEAIALARRAIEAAEKLRGQERHSRVMAAALFAATQLRSLSRFDEAAEDFEAAQAAAAEIGDCDARINAIYGKAYSLFLAKHLSDVRKQGMRAMDLARAAGSEVGVASSSVILAIERWCNGENAAAHEQLDRAIPVLRRSGPVNQAVDAVSFRGIIHSHRLEHEQADHDLRWAYARAGELGLTFNLLVALYHHARTRGNEGYLSEAWWMLEKAQRIADVLDDRFWRPRLLNTKGWLLAELLDSEEALRLNREAASLACGLGDVEAECNSHINAAHDYLSMGEPAPAWKHLEQAEAHYGRDVWFRWIYYPRLQAEMAHFWIARGDLGRAFVCARTSLEHAQQTFNRKRAASARALLGEIAILEDRPEDARREFSAALRVLEHHPCPTLEWRIVRAAADAAGACRDSAGQDELLGRARATVQAIANSVREETLRTTFLASEPVRALGVGTL